MENIELKKLYYTIGEVSEMFSVNNSLIRFWEKEFSIIKPKKNKKGNRLFTQKDIEHFQLIFQLVKIEGYTLEGAKQRLKKGNSKNTEPKTTEIVEKLESIRKKLIIMQTNL